MPNFERNLLQTATYWAPGDADLFGKRSYTRTTLACRWEDKQQLIMDKLGQEVTSKTRVFFASDIDLDGYLFLGTSLESSPLSQDGADEIRQVTRTPDLRNMKTLYVAYL